LPYRFLPELAPADAAFEASGESLEEMFRSAAEAVLAVMLDNSDDLKAAVGKNVELEEGSLDFLLFNFLGEIIYFKDADELLLAVKEIEIENKEDSYRLTARLEGERIARKRHRLTADIKAVTFHRFEVRGGNGCWKAVVILDI